MAFLKMKIHKRYKQLHWLTIIYKTHFFRTVGIDCFEHFNIMQEYFSYSDSMIRTFETSHA